MTKKKFKAFLRYLREQFVDEILPGVGTVVRFALGLAAFIGMIVLLTLYPLFTVLAIFLALVVWWVFMSWHEFNPYYRDEDA
jgi:hypothetical protein